MKSKIVEAKEVVEDEYPKLMSTNGNGKVVLFQKENCGMVVFNNLEHSTQKISYYSTSWVMSDFTPFHGTIELSN